MKHKLKSVAEELRDDLSSCPDLRAQQLIDLDETISELIVAFEQTMRADQSEEWEALKEKIDELRSFAQRAKMRLLFGDAELQKALTSMHDSHPEQTAEELAAIEVERDAHSAHGIRDVFKALLMWKDSPEDRL